MRQLTVTNMGAQLSECGRYRYSLQRDWHSNVPTMPERLLRVMWVGLNPSTADAFRDDPTIRRMMAFSNSWGFRSMVVCNLFAFRATDPRDLAVNGEAIRTQVNLNTLGEMARRSAIVVCAWGGDDIVRADDERLALAHMPLITYCLGHTQSGAPKHPLYLAADTQLEPYGWSPR